MKYWKKSVVIGSLILGCASLASTVVLAAPRFIIDFNIDRAGRDYHRYNTNSMENCLRTCVRESQCRAFTFVPPYGQPGQSNTQGICWLKNGVPEASNATGMISGIKQ